MGTGQKENQFLPIKINTNKEIVDIYANKFNSYLIDKIGRVYAFGECTVIFYFKTVLYML